MTKIKSNIVDKAISSCTEDLLNIEKYSLALSNFISNSDTPITIGLQGEWGTGKTSLMSMLYEDFNRKSIACSWVNTWEYSMFKGPNETTPGVLRGMLEKLEATCKNRNLWPNQDEKNLKFKKAAQIVGNIANQWIANQIGVDVKSALSDTIENNQGIEIAEIKSTISTLISELIQDPNIPLDRVVFFIDDLDRIPPNEAVEILEALKNIFDIPHCIFILAIDYDVVVKGLESKFGVKTEENEREFRSFFDKIIQVPFSMPVGTYDIENFLIEKFKSLGIEIKLDEKEQYTKAVRLSVGSNPRSLKRYLNSYSLINHLKEIDQDENHFIGDDFMLFVLLGIQISYPKIFRALTQKNNFTTWDKSYGSKLGLNLEEINSKIIIFGDSKLLDEEWEKIAWGICQTDSYLKSRAFSVIELLNLVRSTYAESLEVELENAIAFASITNVDDSNESKFSTQKIGNRTIFKGIESKLAQLESENFSQKAILNYTQFWQVLNNKSASNEKYRISFAKTGTSYNDDSKTGRGKQQLIYTSNPYKRSDGLEIWIKSNVGNVKEIKRKMEDFFQIKSSEYLQITSKSDLYINDQIKINYEELINFLLSEIF